jgi:23S rRNA-/tRNA-specific pseudouridylate synthase
VEDSLVARVERLLDAPRGGLHALSRRDVGVSGVVTLARDRAARALVEALRASGRFERRYLALAAAVPSPDAGTWSGAIARQRDGRRGTAGAGAKPAVTRFRSVARAANGASPGVPAALLALSPVTGRTHQLRVHAAAAGAPLLGDRSYGGPTRVRLAGGKVSAVQRPALHALWVELALDSGPLRVEARLPEDFSTLWAELGGAAEDLERAGELELAGASRNPDGEC